MNTPELAHSEIERLVRKFKGLPTAQRKGLSEMQTRLGYILPLFEALGWDTRNINEVSPEEKVSRGWVDFSFRLGNVPRFFLETKRANENLNDPRWVKQAIDYAWTKSVTWALLSDFEGLRVFNAEWKETDPFRAQFIEFDLDSYLMDFERLWWLSKGETSERRLDAEAEKVGKKVKRLPVSQNLFDDLRKWREDLFKNYKGYNPIYSPAQIDEAVLRLLNRLIFIRTAEDREVEQVQLRALLRELKDRKQFKNLDRELAALFRRMDATYNSELFAPHFSEELLIAPTALEEVIEGLYEKNYVRYNFNALDADVLGTAYEQYLGHVVAESEGGTHVQEKRAKRKSQGIYYTPAFVTKYIVQQTVRRHLEEHGYHPSHPLRVLDMACGSGSFLIEAFDVIDGYVAKQRGQAHKGEVDIYDRARQLEVLQNCIFGVDKDKQAVEVARLNLLLRGLHSREKLPMLENIHHGNSLVSGTSEELQRTFGEDWQAQIPFDWEKEFAPIMKNGGFDVIVGNPPYGMLQPHNTDQELLGFLNAHYEVASFKIDLFHLFIERSISILKDGGYLGLIVPNTFITNVYTEKLRKLIASQCKIIEIVVSSERMFVEAEVNNAIIILQKDQHAERREVNQIKIVLDADSDYLIGEASQATIQSLQQGDLVFLDSGSWNIKLSNETVILIKKFQTVAEQLGTIAKINRGLISGDRDKYFSRTKKGEKWKPIITGTDVERYSINPAKEYVLFEKPKGAGGTWDSKVHLSEKIVIRQIGYYPIASYDTHPYCVTGNIFTVRSLGTYKPEYLLAILNSKFTHWLWQLLYGDFKAIFPELKGIYLEQYPIRRINFDDPAEKSAHYGLVSLVEQMLALHQERQSVRPEDDLDRARTLDRRIAEVDKEIDRRVYELYGLTEEEIKVVEGT